jgi:protein tyrosine/serine phosphatase
MIIQKPKLHKNKQTTFIKKLNIRTEILLNKSKTNLLFCKNETKNKP